MTPQPHIRTTPSGYPIFGDADERTVQQLERCATFSDDVAGAALMADGHLGYSMPIGGVVAHREHVSPSGVGYDISCIAGGARVITRQARSVEISNVTRADSLLCWDGDNVREVFDHIGAVARGRKSILRIRTADCRGIGATPDHRFMTKSGWKQASDLEPGEQILVSPFIGIADEPSHWSLFSGASLPPSISMAQNIATSQYPILFRLLGYISGDGHLSRSSNRVSIFTSMDEDVPELSTDLQALGLVPRTNRRIRPNGSIENHIYLNSASFHSLLSALGSPVGKKRWSEASMAWMDSAPLSLQLDFLGGFAAAEMSTPSRIENRMANPAIKQGLDGRSALLLCKRILNRIGLRSSVSPSGRDSFVLQVLGGGAGGISLLELVPLPYAAAKRRAFARAYSVHHKVSEAVTLRTMARDEARAMHAARTPWPTIIKTITEKYPVCEGFVRRTPFTGNGKPRVWKHRPIEDTQGELVWMPVKSIAEDEEAVVYDIVTSDPAASFFANGFVVHNCGNKAVRTDLTHDDIRADLPALMDQIASDVSFGLGRTNSTPVEHPVLDDSAWSLPQISHLRERAISQLGTVGSGNHYVDLMVDEADGAVWIAVHFGSRGFGHGVASGFLNLAAGRAFDAKAPGETMEQPPTLIPIATDLGESYIAAMELAKRYAYAGRDVVVDQVARILGTSQTMAVHNNHNDASLETHGGEDVWVVRKGATPAFPGQLGFIGGSMCDQAVIIRGKDSPLAREALHSAPHGAGRIMSRTRAAGKWRRVDVGGRKRRMRVGGEVTPERMRAAVADYGIELRGGGVDESPFVYRRLADVLAQHSDTIDVVHTLRPIGVAMAGADVADPFKD